MLVIKVDLKAKQGPEIKGYGVRFPRPRMCEEAFGKYCSYNLIIIDFWPFRRNTWVIDRMKIGFVAMASAATNFSIWTDRTVSE